MKQSWVFVEHILLVINTMNKITILKKKKIYIYTVYIYITNFLQNIITIKYT